jgi:hypothetical protein
MTFAPVPVSTRSAVRWPLLLRDEVAGPVSNQALKWLGDLAEQGQSLIPTMAGRAEELVGDPEDVAERTWVFIQEILENLDRAAPD